MTRIFEDEKLRNRKRVFRDRLEIGPEGGEAYIVTVAGFSDSSVILDMNHPLAGKDLIFDIQLLEIV